MKFLIREHKSIKGLVISKALNIDDFSFTKRRGKLHIKCNSNDSEFVFYRKTETVLDDKNKWSKQNSYQIYQPVKRTGIKDWNEVLYEIENWMNEFC